MTHRPCTHCGSPGPFYAGPRRRYHCTTCEKRASRDTYALKQARALATLRRRAAAGEALTRREQVRLLRATCPPGSKVCTHCLTAKARGWFYRSPRTRDGRRQYCRQCDSERTAEQAYNAKEKHRAA